MRLQDTKRLFVHCVVMLTLGNVRKGVYSVEAVFQ